MSRLSDRVRWAAILGAAAAVLLVGGIYTAVRPITYESRAQLVLHLGKVRPESTSSLLDSFLRAGGPGTFVEHVQSAQTLRGAGSPPVTIQARQIPDTRVIEATASGGKAFVQPGLSAVIRSAQLTQNVLKDPFRLGVLSPPGGPVKAGPSTALLLIATVLLAALAALFVYVVTRRPAPAATPYGIAGTRPDLRPAPAASEPPRAVGDG